MFTFETGTFSIEIKRLNVTSLSKSFRLEDVVCLFFMSFGISLFVGNMMPVQVLNLEHVPRLKNGLDDDNMEERQQWSVQRIRLSPQEKHLAATVKSDYREELR